MTGVASDPATAVARVWEQDATAMVWQGAGRPHAPLAVPSVTPAPGDVLVEIELATVCGSDSHTVQGHRSAPTPLVLGHEYVGRVVAVQGEPEAADGQRLQPGDRVIWSIFAACRACDRCLRGLPQKCRDLRKYGHERVEPRWQLSGGFATHAHLRAGTSVVRVGEGIAAEVLAPAACGSATAWAALARAERVVDLAGAVVLVLGAGLIGLTAAAIAADRGARVVMADPDAGRAALARAFGAVAVIDPTQEGAVPAALRDVGADQVDVVVEASGSPHAVDLAVREVGVGGAVVLVGSVFPAGTVAIDPEQIVRRLITIRGVHNYDPTDLLGAAEFLRTRGDAYPFASLVGARFALADIDAAISEAARGSAVRVAVVPVV